MTFWGDCQMAQAQGGWRRSPSPLVEDKDAVVKHMLRAVSINAWPFSEDKSVRKGKDQRFFASLKNDNEGRASSEGATTLL